MKKYKVKFQNIFDFSISYREVELTELQYIKTLEHIKNQKIVVDYFDKAQNIHVQLIIIEIKEII